MSSSHQTVKRFSVIQGKKVYPAGGYSTACQLAQNLMMKDPTPCKVEIEFNRVGWGVQKELELA